jgi:hypothetical protein
MGWGKEVGKVARSAPGSDELIRLEKFEKILRAGKYNASSPMFDAMLKFLKSFPVRLEHAKRKHFLDLVCKSFEIAEEELVQRLSEVAEESALESANTGKSPEELEHELWEFFPSGFYNRYAEFTRLTESPLAYHIFAAVVAVGAVCNRRVFFDMAHFRYFPATGIIILGPSGIKKTSAANIAVDLVMETKLCSRYSEKLTPEALIEAMRTNAQGVVYAPELSVLMGKQKYNEGLVPLLTRFMDCPDAWRSDTISRGTAPLVDIALSFIGCSTPDWFINNTPPDTFGGGFIARILLIMQFECNRIVRIPKIPDASLKATLLAELINMHSMQGEMRFSTAADKLHEEWYFAFKKIQKHPEHELLLTYYQRKPDHLLRLIMALHIADCRTMELCIGCVDKAIKLLGWIEQFLPPMFRSMFRTAAGEEQEYILRVIRSVGGAIEHTSLLRKTQHRMDASRVKSIIGSLKEADLVEEQETSLIHLYKAKM